MKILTDLSIGGPTDLNLCHAREVNRDFGRSLTSFSPGVLRKILFKKTHPKADCKMISPAFVKRFVQGVLGFYYKSDSKVQQDPELQKWIQDIYEHGFLSQKETGELRATVSKKIRGF